MEEWKEYKLGEIADIQTGPFGSQLHKSDYVEDGIPCIMPTNIGQQLDIDVSNIAHINEIDANRLNRHLVKEGDIIYARRGDIEKCAYISEKENGWFCGTGCLRLRINETNNPHFIAYYLSTQDCKKWIVGNAVGTTMLNLNSSILKELPLYLPSKKTQSKIVSILKSLDDKIENNRKINENLEQQAQALFKSWFVDFEPFRDQPFVVSELGMIPEGWRVGTLSEIAEYSKLRISIKEIDTHTYVSTENMLANKQGITEASGLPDVENVTKYEIGDVLISNIRPYFKKLHYCNHIGGCSGDVMCFHPLSKEYRGYLYCSLYDDVFFDYVMSGAKGTKMPRGDKRQIMNYRIIIPSNSIINQFNNFVLLLLSQIDNNRKQSLHLSQLRDTLLPKLMSGEIAL